MSSDANTRAVDFKVASSQNYSFGNGVFTLVDYNSTPIVDSHGGWQAGGNTDRYVVQVPGDYLCGVGFETNAFAGVVNRANLLAAFKGGVIVDSVAQMRTQTATSCSKNTNGATLLSGLKAGDLIDIRAYNDDAAVVGSGDTTRNFFWLKKISGPAQIMAAESIDMRAANTAGTSISNAGDVIVPFATESWDSQGCWVTDTFTAKSSGKYKVHAQLWFASALYAAGNRAYAGIQKNGANHSFGSLHRVYVAETNVITCSVSDTIQLLKDETIKIFTQNNRTGGATALDTGAGENYVTIERVGNY
jgi:hypothetical protein